MSSFTKGGRVGGYESLITFIPDLNFGWTIAASGESYELPEGFTKEITNVIYPTLLKLWHDVAREQAGATFAGRYVASEPGLNSSLTIRVDDGLPGIGVYDWISNGTSMAPWTVAFGWALKSPEELNNMIPSTRLYPTMIEEALPDGGKRVSFRAVYEDLSDDPVLNKYVVDCNTWVRTIAIYGSKPIDLFVFTLDKSGKAVAIENMATRAVLHKVA